MLDSFEYTFFDEEIAQKFCRHIEGMGQKALVRTEEAVSGEGMTYEVSIDGTLDDDAAAQLEDLYSEMLFGEQAAQIEGNVSGAIADACGVQVQLSNGEFTTVAIHPEIMNKILSVLTIEEVQKFLAQVAEDIENPKSGPICRRENLPDA